MVSSLLLTSWLPRRHTSPSVKDLIVAAAGVDDPQWKDTYMKDASQLSLYALSKESLFIKSTTVP
jgi:enoyl reductase-like protein